MAGNSNIRNPILASFVAKKLLPYRGLGSGIQRSLEEWPHIEFIDDREGCTFKAIINRIPVTDEPLKKPVKSGEDDLKVHFPQKNEPLNEPLNDLQVQMIEFIKNHPKASYEDLSQALNRGRSTIMRHIQKLKNFGLISRVGSKKSGKWEVQKKGLSAKNE